MQEINEEYISLRQRQHQDIDFRTKTAAVRILHWGVVEMNIGFYRYSLYNRGGDRLIAEYANFLARMGHQVTLHLRTIKSMFAIDPKVTIRTIKYPGKAGTLLYAATHAFNHDITVVDIIHLPFALSFRNKVVYYAQADDREYYSNPILKKIIDLLYRKYFSSGMPVISMSQHLTEIFRQRYNVNGVYTIKTGIDHGSFYPDHDDVLLKQKGKKKAVVFMARGDSYRKGYDTALKVFMSFQKDISEKMELWVCGNHHEDNRYFFQVRNFGVVSDSRLRQVLSSADIFFYPSRHEGFGLFPLEAMACGCAVVTTDAVPYARTMPGILTTEVDGVTDLRNNLGVLIAEDDLLKRLRMQAVMAAHQFDIKKSKISFNDALSRIVAG